jgi:cytochrome c biogenesis protein CcdA
MTNTEVAVMVVAYLIGLAIVVTLFGMLLGGIIENAPK